MTEESLLDVFEEQTGAEVVESTQTESPSEPKESEAKQAENNEAEADKTEQKPDKEESGQLAAIKAERQKRQQAEEKLKQYEMMSSEIPNPKNNPEGYKQFFEDEGNVKRLQERIALSVEVMTDAAEDYPEMEKIFVEMMSKDPDLKVGMQMSKNPAKFAYQTAKNHKEAQDKAEAEKVEAIKSQYEKELREKILAELEATKSHVSPAKKPNLTGATAVGGNSTRVETLPDLEDLFA